MRHRRRQPRQRAIYVASEAPDMANSRVAMIDVPAITPPAGMYSHVSHDTGLGLFFVAGQLAFDSSGNIVGKGDFVAQMRQVFANLEGALKAAGCTFNDVLKFTTYMTRDSDIPAFMDTRRELYATIFPDGTYPPNTLLIISRLVHPDCLIEIEAIAAAKR
jgi:enamine deaminase RidA (YjgF/YER057c/UK114 family)